MAMVPMSLSSGDGWKPVIFFDMDSTVIDAEGIIELARARGVGDYVADVTARTMNGELDFEHPSGAGKLPAEGPFPSRSASSWRNNLAAIARRRKLRRN